MPLSRSFRSIFCSCLPWHRPSKRRNYRDPYIQDLVEHSQTAPTHHENRHQWNDEAHKIEYHIYKTHSVTTEKQKATSKYASHRIHENRINWYSLNTIEPPAINAQPAIDISDRLFVYDTAISGLEPGKVLYRRVLLDFDPNRTTNIISDEIPQTLDLPIAPYTGPMVCLPSGKSVMPVGTVEVNWSVFEGSKPYRMQFVVIENSHYDMLLSRGTIKQHEFWDEDRRILERMNLQS
ncbi:hypothetical protein BDV19DRAFT_284964 [Aspergillus venezuelensis]